MTDSPLFAEFFPPRFPESIARLFSLNTKAEVTKYVQGLTIHQDDLVCAIAYPSLGGYAHMRGHYEWQPDDAQLTPDDIDIVRDEGRHHEIGRFVAKLNNWRETRKHLSAHLFVQPGRWHVLYFTFNDMEAREPNHWKFGSHVHFVNYLWPQYKLEEMKGLLFGQRRTLISDSIHIRVSVDSTKGNQVPEL